MGVSAAYLVSWLSTVEVSKYWPLKMLLRSVRQVSESPPMAPYVGYKYPAASCAVPRTSAVAASRLVDPMATEVSHRTGREHAERTFVRGKRFGSVSMHRDFAAVKMHARTRSPPVLSIGEIRNGCLRVLLAYVCARVGGDAQRCLTPGVCPSRSVRLSDFT